MMQSEIIEKIEQLSLLRREAYATFVLRKDIISKGYLRKPTDDNIEDKDELTGMINRQYDPKNLGNCTTSTAFCLYYLSFCLAQAENPDIRSSAIFKEAHQILTKDEIATAAKELLRLLENNIWIENNNDSTIKNGSTERTPNNYKILLRLAGILKTHNFDSSLLPNLCADCRIQRMVDLASKCFVPEIRCVAERERRPSPYLSFWYATAMIEWLSAHKIGESERFLSDKIERNEAFAKTVLDLEFYTDQNQREQVTEKLIIISETLSLLKGWAEMFVAQSIANWHSGNLVEFDSISSIYATLTMLMLSKDDPDKILHVRELVKIIIEENFKNGCLMRSNPVTTSRHQYSVQISTVEAFSLLIVIVPKLFDDYWYGGKNPENYLSQSITWIQNNYKGGHGKDAEKQVGWCSECEDFSEYPNVFTISSVLLFLLATTVALDNFMHRLASAELRVEEYVFDERLDATPYPDGMEDFVENHILYPIKTLKDRSLACYSLILTGGPGTGKTSIVKKLAQKLKWPLLIINQNEFFHDGLDSVDACAERIFKMVLFLQDVVVLFDEAEELIIKRDPNTDKRDRVLTTSMLPRIHDLRDKQNVIFVFATNYDDRIDNAAKRIGRFDRKFVARQPESDERKNIIRKLTVDLDLDDGTIQQVADMTNDYLFGDLKELVRKYKIFIKQSNVTQDFCNFSRKDIEQFRKDQLNKDDQAKR